VAIVINTREHRQPCTVAR